MKTVLILDNNLGFIYWLGEALVAANYKPWPACNPADAAILMGNKRLGQLDLLIVNPALRGATQFISRVRKLQPDLKVLAVGTHSQKTTRGIDAWCAAPSPDDDSAKRKWVREVDRVISRQSRAA